MRDVKRKKEKGRRGKLGRGRLSTFFPWAGHDVMNLKCLAMRLLYFGYFIGYRSYYSLCTIHSTISGELQE